MNCPSSLKLAGVLLVLAVGAAAQADGLLYRYEGNVVPLDPSAGWIVGNPCDPPCTESVENGRFVLRWPQGRDAANYDLTLPAPSLPTLWVEWRFRSNHPFGGVFDSCDGQFSVRYAAVLDTLLFFGDAVISFSGGLVMSGLDINELHTYRFESIDGSSYRWYVDGRFFSAPVDNKMPGRDRLQLRGSGGCDTTRPPTVVNEWDFVRYGTIGTGERIVASDPPAGLLDAAQYLNLTRFTVTFDQPNYVLVSQIAVTVSGGPVPQVVQTRRRDPTDPLQVDDDPYIVEIVLDRPLTVGQTTTFTMSDGATTNEVAYTLVQPAACCLPDGTCAPRIEPDCTAQGGTFHSGQTCTGARACCAPDGSCRAVDPVCCVASGGSPAAGSDCEGDQDADGIDAACGDACPSDAVNDQDGDGLCADVDPCPELNPNDADNNGTPDCLKPPAIPALSRWGLVVLGLALATAARLRHRTTTVPDAFAGQPPSSPP